MTTLTATLAPTATLTVCKDGKPLYEVRPDARGSHVVSVAGPMPMVAAFGFPSMEAGLAYAEKRALLPPTW